MTAPVVSVIVPVTLAKTVWPKPTEADKRSTATSEIRLMKIPPNLNTRSEPNPGVSQGSTPVCQAGNTGEQNERTKALTIYPQHGPLPDDRASLLTFHVLHTVVNRLRLMGAINNTDVELVPGKKK